MTLQTGKIYKVKEGHKGKCKDFEYDTRSKYIQIISIKGNRIEYNILNQDKEPIDECHCFTEDDLELEGEVKEKSLEDLEVGDEAIKRILNLIDKMKEEARVGTGWTCDGKLMTLRFDKLINEIKDITNYNPITTFSPSEAETLLEEKLGIKVKIKN